jgi:hypothetical protein
VLGEEGQAAGGGVVQEAVSSMTCLPLLSRLGEEKGPGDHEQQCTVKEEIVSGGSGGGGATSDLAQSGVDLNIGLPVGGSCIEDAIMEEKGDEEEEEEEDDAVDQEGEDESEEWKHMHGGCKAEGVDQQQEHDEAVPALVEGSNSIVVGVGEFGVVGEESGLPIAGCRYWIPTPAQILIGPVQFICHVCNKTFNRYNNMQVCYHVYLPIYWIELGSYLLPHFVCVSLP